MNDRLIDTIISYLKDSKIESLYDNKRQDYRIFTKDIGTSNRKPYITFKVVSAEINPVGKYNTYDNPDKYKHMTFKYKLTFILVCRDFNMDSQQNLEELNYEILKYIITTPFKLGNICVPIKFESNEFLQGEDCLMAGSVFSIELEEVKNSND